MGSGRRSDPVFVFLTGGRGAYYRVKNALTSPFVIIFALDRCHLKRREDIGGFVAGEVLFTRLQQKCFTYQRETVALSELLIILRSSETARPRIGFPPRQI